MKRWLLLGCLCCFSSQVMAGMPLSFARRPPAQSMLQADAAPPESAVVAKASEASEDDGSQVTTPTHANQASDVSSLVSVDDESEKPVSTPKQVSTQKKQVQKAVPASQAPSRWESIEPQGEQQDDTFVVTDPEPAMLAGQVSALEQAQSELTDKLSQQQESQSDQLSELTLKVMQLKKATMLLGQVVKSVAKAQEKLSSVPKKSESLLKRQWLGLSALAWFLIVFGALFVLLLISFWAFLRQQRAVALTRLGVFLCVAESYVVLGDAESAKRVLKQVLSKGSAEEKARAATIMAKLV